MNRAAITQERYRQQRHWPEHEKISHFYIRVLMLRPNGLARDRPSFKERKQNSCRIVELVDQLNCHCSWSQMQEHNSNINVVFRGMFAISHLNDFICQPIYTTQTFIFSYYYYCKSCMIHKHSWCCIEESSPKYKSLSCCFKHCK